MRPSRLFRLAPVLALAAMLLIDWPAASIPAITAQSTELLPDLVTQTP